MTLAPLIKEALKLLRSSVPANVGIISRIETDRDNVMADPTQMHQIMLNLCGNASHAMQKTGGTLTVTLADVHEDDAVLPPDALGRPERFVRLSVADTGAGIDPDVVERIFDPFSPPNSRAKGPGWALPWSTASSSGTTDISNWRIIPVKVPRSRLSASDFTGRTSRNGRGSRSGLPRGAHPVCG